MHYEIDIAAEELLANPPDVQVVDNGNAWRWSPLVFSDKQSDLSKITFILKTIRNNLFHGGKHGAEGWDEPDRVEFLLCRGIQVLNSFSVLARLESDYMRIY